jgi:hypothetical protein
VPEIVAAHPVLGFEMADDGLDGGTPSQLAFDLWIHEARSTRWSARRRAGRVSDAVGG